MILTDQHQHPPRLINTGTGTVASAALIKQGDVARMASLGLYRHESVGPGPYTEWTLTSDEHGPLFQRTTRELTADEIEQRREQLHQVRSAERVRRQTGGFPYNGYTFASDLGESVPLLTNAVLNAHTAVSVGPEAVAAYEAKLGSGWRDIDSVPRLKTLPDILALHSAFVAYGADVDAASQALKAQIAAAEPADFAALEAAIIDDSNWPRT